MIKKPTLRKCVCCREMKDKKELFRIVSFEQKVLYDKTGKAQGRGSYVCVDCLNANKLKKAFLSRALKTEISESDYQEIMEGITNCL